MLTQIEFKLPDALMAKEPPERRGVARDGVRLMVLDRATGAVSHTRFDRIGETLRAGDLLVFNTSRTLPASLAGRAAGSGAAVELRLAERLPDDTWLALLLCDGPDPFACGLGEGLALLNLGTNEYFSLNEVGAFIWRVLQTPRARADIIRAVMEAFEVAEDACAADIDFLLEELKNAALAGQNHIPLA